MNFPFTIGKGINRGTHFEYQKITFPASSPLKIGRMRAGYSLIENAQEIGASGWHDMLDTFQIRLDSNSLNHLNTQLSATPSGNLVFLFEVPNNGRITVVEKDERLLLLFQTFDYHFWEIPLGNNSDTTKRPLGNTLVFAREPFNHFQDTNVHAIIKEALINWSVANRGSRLLLFRDQNNQNNQNNQNIEISSDQTNQINGDRRIANQIVNLLTNPGGAAFDNRIYMPSHNYYLPVKEGDLVPLFYINDANRLLETSVDPLRYKIGISDIPLTGNAIANEKWSWFHALEFLIRKDFGGVVLQQQEAPPASTFSDYARTNSLKGWYPLSATLNASRISKIKYKNLELYNPIQNETPQPMAPPLPPPIRAISLGTLFFNGNDTAEVHSLTNSNWEKQTINDINNISPLIIPTAIGNNVNSVNVSTPADEFLKINKIGNPKSFNVIINHVQHYNSDGSSTNDNEYYLDIFINRVKDVRFYNSGEINNWFNVNYNMDFIDWYNANFTPIFRRQLGGGHGSPIIYEDINLLKQRFNLAWNNVDKMFPSTGYANFIQFICLMMETGTELGWTFYPGGEGGDLSYTFKYDKNRNNLTKDLFQTGSLFRNTHENNAPNPSSGYNTNQRIKGLTAAQIVATWYVWGVDGDGNPKREFVYPIGYDKSTDTNSSGMISEADFHKFRGRGIIQNTWRGSYRRLITEILRIRNLPDTHPNITSIANAWLAHPHTEDQIATISTNSQWDLLFTETDFQIACYAVNSHALGWGAAPGTSGYWDLPMETQLLLKTGNIRDKSIWSVGAHINGGNPLYAPGLVSKVMEVVKKLSI